LSGEFGLKAKLLRSGINASESVKPDGILILDFGGQYCHLIARRVREMGVYSEILSCDSSKAEIEDLDTALSVRGLILSGSPASIRMEDAPRLGKGVLGLGFPILGLCYGHQLVAYMHGGDVRMGERREYGIAEVTVDSPISVLEGMNPGRESLDEPR